MSCIRRVLSAAFCAAMLASPGWSQTDAETGQLITSAERAQIAALLQDRSVLLVPRFMVNKDGIIRLVYEDFDVVAVQRGDLIEAIINRWVLGTMSPEQIMKGFLLFDRAYRAALAREFNVPLSAPTPGPSNAAGTSPEPDATHAASDPQAQDLPDAVLPYVWSGGLDGDELADVTARFNAKAGQEVQGYSASPILLILDDSGTVEIAGQAFCQVKTRTATTNGQDHVTVTTVSSYETDGPQPLAGNGFEVRMRTQRVVTTDAGPAGAPGESVLIRRAVLSDPDATGARHLRIYNGVPSVDEAAWRLVPLQP